MKASTKIEVTIDGIHYVINKDEVIPSKVLTWWESCNKVARMKAQGIISDGIPAQPKVVEQKK